MLTWLLVLSSLIELKGNSVIVDSPAGRLSGWKGLSREGRAYWAFTKLPYAEPPVGKFRLQNPVPLERWKGVYEAIENAPKCIQDEDGDEVSWNVTGTEDCLYLNVYVPVVNKTNLPVVISVYGGAFKAGAIGPRYVADFFMDEDVILVAMSYRTGPLGFMSLEDKYIPGNFGLKDQALALKWVKTNIGSFGGDPNLMTILGVSAGAASTHHLMLAPETRDLIKGAVTISGTVNKVWSLKPKGLMRKRTFTAANFLGCNEDNSRLLLACLQKLDAWKIHTSRHLFEFDIAFAPTIEPKAKGAFITENPLSYRSKTPWWNTITNGERLLKYEELQSLGKNYIDKITSSELNKYIGRTVELSLDEMKPNERRILNKIKAKYFDNNATDKAYQLGLLFEDVTFVYPALDALERHEGPVYFGRFECDVLNDGFKIASHGSESKLLYKKALQERLLPMVVSKRYLKYVSQFAKTQEPTANQGWIPWTSNQMLRITCSEDFMGQPEDYAGRENIHGFWKGLFCDPSLEIA